MRSVLYGIMAMVIVSAIAWIVLDMQSTPSSERFVSENNSVRLD